MSLNSHLETGYILLLVGPTFKLFSRKDDKGIFKTSYQHYQRLYWNVVNFNLKLTN